MGKRRRRKKTTRDETKSIGDFIKEALSIKLEKNPRRAVDLIKSLTLSLSLLSPLHFEQK